MPATCKHIVMFFFALTLSLFAFFVCLPSAFADGSSSNEEWTQPDNIFDSCEWKWDAYTNTFKIRPCAGVEIGKLKYKLPWKDYSNRVEVIEFEGPISTSLCDHLFAECWNLREIKGFSNLDTSNATNMYWMFAYCESLESVDLSNLNTSNVTDMSGMFVGCHSLKTIDVSSFNTSKVKSFGRYSQSGMFFGCQSLESIDVSGFDTSNAKSMDYMFSRCFSLKSLDLSNFDTSSVTSMSNMFCESSSLEAINLSRFDTSNVEKMSKMFSGCLSLKRLDLSNFNTSSAIYMSSMFNECISLESVDLSKFNTRNVAEFDFMFCKCESLQSLDLACLDTSKAKSMNGMFKDCYSLTSLNLSTFDTSNATGIGSMFSGCSSIKSLDLSNFDTSKVTSMSELFQDCFALTSINMSNFKITGSCRMERMFKGCRSLSYINMSNYDTMELDIDELNNNLEIYSSEVFPDASENPSYTINIGPKFTLQPYLTMGYWVGTSGTWYEEYVVPNGVKGTYEYRGGIKSISFNSNPCILTIDTPTTLPATFVQRERVAGYDVIWTSSNPSVVKVNVDAPFVHPLKLGKATITATVVQSGKKYSCDVEVKEQFWQDDCQDEVLPSPVSPVTVKPSLEKVFIKKLSKSKRGFTVKWSKPTSKYLKSFTGYKIRYSTYRLMWVPITKTVKASSSSAKKRTLKISKLKSKKKYYIQVATYRIVDGKLYLSKWSKVKSIKTK